MIPAKYDFEKHYKGDKWDGVEFTIIDLDTDTPIDLTGVALKCQFRKQSKTGTIINELTDGNGITVLDAVNGEIKLDAMIIDWIPTSYYYDVQFTFAVDDIRTYVRGILPITQDTTV